MKVRVHGYGSMGSRHARNARLLGHEVSVRDGLAVRMQAARRDGFMAGSGDPDAVIIAVPAHGHAAMLATALAARQHVYIEKPLALSMDDLANHAAINLTPPSVVMVGYNWRFDPRATVLRTELALRTPISARFVVSCDGSRWPGGSYADALLECSHEVDLALFLLGPATCTAASATGLAAPAGQLAGSWDLLLEHYDTGVVSSIHLDTVRVGASAVRYCEVLCREGMLRWDLATSDVEVTYLLALSHFLDCVQLGVNTDCTLLDGARVLAICDTARRLAAAPGRADAKTRP